MTARPTGTVTFLFSDVEGSTALLLRLGPAEYARALDDHRAALRGVWEAHGGVEIDTQGDAFFVAFETAGAAVAAARAAQEALRAAPLRVRIGVHTGEPLVTDEGYVGMDVHRAARIAAVAHGGQSIMSQATRDLIADDDVIALGEHRLKDLTRAERLYQVGRERFPGLRSLNSAALPEAAHPMVGRSTEQAEVSRLLRQERLVTITGAGGTGKTRLALQVAGELLEEFSDGVRFVSLAGVSDAELVLPVALDAFGLVAADDTSGWRALLVLDNFEHVAAAAPSIAEFLSRSKGITLLVTSRAPLHVTMECEYPLDPLPHPAAVELFLDRARAIQRDVGPSKEVDEICDRLDGLPLAIELAAARLKLLDPQHLLTRLESRLTLLTHGPADLPERQRTLEATIAWSFDLLDEPAQRLLTELSVFAGTFDLEAVEAIQEAHIDTVAALVDASLIKSRGDSRFLMLDTVREFARDRIDAGAALRLPARHADYYLRTAEAAEPHLTGADAAGWLARLAADEANFRAALDWLVLESPELVPRLALALWRFWLTRGRYDEGEAAISRAVSLESAPDVRAELVYRLGAIVISQGDVARARTLFEDALREFRANGLGRGEARSLSALGHAAADAGDWPDAIRLYEDAAEMFRRVDDDSGLGNVLGDLATVHLRSGAPERARTLADESRGLQHRFGNRQGEALALATHGYADLLAGRLAAARAALEESTTIAHALGYQHGLLFSLNGLAAVAYRDGDALRAARLFRAAQSLRATLGIERDPDDDLVAADRAAALAAAGIGVEAELDLDAAVALAVG
jgi:predicted ATPase/class 3 adenylate cyclase